MKIKILNRLTYVTPNLTETHDRWEKLAISGKSLNSNC